MSILHPIISVTGSSGAGTSTARLAFEHIFHRLHVKPAFIDGDAFHAYSRQEMAHVVRRATVRGENFSHFSPSANVLDRLETLFAQYSANGSGETRRYLHDEIEAAEFDRQPGTFTDWTPIDPDTELLLYEGLHGGVMTDQVDVAQYVDLMVGVVPTINLEWIQKIRRDIDVRGYAPEDVTEVILRRMPDYVRYITPQFSRTDINFQRVPLVDTSNPFVAREVPSADESLVVIRFGDATRTHMDFPYLLAMIQGAFMARPNTLVIPGGKLGFAMELILTPFISRLSRGERIRE